jgi:hypothetical protein
MIRFTKDIIDKTLKLNEGYTDTTYYKGKNITETNNYRIHDGKLYVRSKGKTSWADSRFDEEYECDIDRTRRFLRDRKDELNLPE